MAMKPQGLQAFSFHVVSLTAFLFQLRSNAGNTNAIQQMQYALHLTVTLKCHYINYVRTVHRKPSINFYLF